MEPSFDDVKVDNMLTTSVPIKSVKVHANLQPRVEMNDDHVKQIVNALVDNNNVLDDKPIHCWNIKNDIANSVNGLYVVDGHHRFKAFRDKSLKFQTVDVIIHESERPENVNDFEFEAIQMSDALKFAIKANNHHGSPLKRSQADNRRAITLILDDRTNVKMSDSAIAELCGVSAPTVAKVRKSKLAYQSETRVTSDGRTISHTRQSSGVLARVPVVTTHTAVETPLSESPGQMVVNPETESVQPVILVQSSGSVYVDFNASVREIAGVLRQSMTRERLRELVEFLPLRKPAVVPPAVPSPAVPSPDKRRRFDWSNLESVRESMEHSVVNQGVTSARFTKWHNDFSVVDKRVKYPNLPDDEALKVMWLDVERVLTTIRSLMNDHKLEQSA